jgi:hypothetical protein
MVYNVRWQSSPSILPSGTYSYGTQRHSDANATTRHMSVGFFIDTRLYFASDVAFLKEAAVARIPSG